MPKGYEKIRDKLVAEGTPLKEAKTIAARIWNAKHPKNPVHRGYDKKKRK